jgi:hypothetical protein
MIGERFCAGQVQIAVSKWQPFWNALGLESFYKR